jgi:hypothetical protein
VDDSLIWIELVVLADPIDVEDVAEEAMVVEEGTDSMVGAEDGYMLLEGAAESEAEAVTSSGSGRDIVVPASRTRTEKRVEVYIVALRVRSGLRVPEGKMLERKEVKTSSLYFEMRRRMRES